MNSMTHDDNGMAGFDAVHMDDLIAGRVELDDPVEIDQVLLVIKAAQKKVDFLRKLKQRRAFQIDAQVKEQEARIDKLKEAVQKCMVKTSSKSLDFPEMAKVSLRKTKGTWVIKDEEALVAHLKKLGKFDEVAQTTVKFNKTELNKLLNELEKNANTSAAVEREAEKDTLSISFHATAALMESIDDLLPTPVQAFIPAGTSLMPTKRLDLSAESFSPSDIRF